MRERGRVPAITFQLRLLATVSATRRDSTPRTFVPVVLDSRRSLSFVRSEIAGDFRSNSKSNAAAFSRRSSPINAIFHASDVTTEVEIIDASTLGPISLCHDFPMPPIKLPKRFTSRSFVNDVVKRVEMALSLMTLARAN